MKTIQKNNIDDPKAYFHRVSTELESVLEQYKNQYPKNIGQIIRHHSGRIIIGTAAVFFFIAFFCMSPTLMLFLFAGMPGVLIFVYKVQISNQTEDVSNNFSLEQIQQLKTKLQPLESYPDVKKYSDSFDVKFNEVTAQKANIKSRFKRYVITALAFGGFIVMVLLIRINIYNKMGWTDDVLASPDETYIQDVLDIKYDEPLFTLKPLNQGVNGSVNALDFSVDKYHDLYVSGLKVDEATFGLSYYALIITDKDGKYVPRCPKFYFSVAKPTPSYGYTDEPLRIYLFLRNNQNELRYKIEKL